MTVQDHDAVWLLLERHRPRLVSAIQRRMYMSRDEAEDICQRVMVKAFTRFSLFRGDSELYTWLYSIALNEVKNFLRERSRESSLDSLSDLEVAQIQVRDPGPTAEEAYIDGAEQTDRSTLVQRAMEALDADSRRLILLHYWEELTYEQVAEHEHLTVGAVKSRLHRVRGRMGKMLRAMRLRGAE